ncbi:MAG: hypothetical protein Q8O76_11080 [Chloroflexota bacterium]|nr:hypothetical protein [Chloroflexota bacterium]
MGSQAQSAVARFKEALERYNLLDKWDLYLRAIQSSHLTNGRLPGDLPAEDALVLRQLDIGWPRLTAEGSALARELVDTTIKTSDTAIQKVWSRYPPRVVALFLQAASRAADIYSFMVKEAQDFEQLSDVGRLTDLVWHRKLYPLFCGLADDLAGEGLAATYSALDYYGAKYKEKAKFIYFPAAVADKLARLLSVGRVSLEGPERLLTRYSLLRQTPVPPVQGFNGAGVSTEELEECIADARNAGVVTKLADRGPAFLVLDQERYKQVVLRPLFDNIVETFFKEAPITTPVEQKTPQSPGKGAVTKSPAEPYTTPGNQVVIGAGSLDKQWGVLGMAEDRRVFVDLNAPHVAFVCGKMGAGKGYTIGVLCEMLAGETFQGMTHIERPATIVVLYRPREDVPSEFATIGQANDNASEISLLKKTYGHEPRIMIDPKRVRVFIDPFVYQKNRVHFERQYATAGVKPLYADPSSLGGQEWSIVLAAGGRTDQLYVKRLFATLERLQFEPFDLSRVLNEVIADQVMNANQKNLAQQRIDLLRNYLAGPATEDFVRNLAVGGVNIFDFRKTIRTADDVFSLMTLVISVLQTKKGLEEEPFVFVINEAHDYFKGGVSADFVESIEHLIRRRRHGKNWLLLDTHFPDDVDDRVIQLADLKFVYYLDKATTSTILNRAFGHFTDEFSNLRTGEALVAADQSSEGLSKVFRVSVRPRLTKHGGATKTAV